MDGQETSPPAPFDLATLKAMMEQRVEAGGIRDDLTYTLADPADPQCDSRLDPLTRLIAHSDALAQRLGEHRPEPHQEQP